ncbi:unnamed protein product, partial [Schistosoma turkestanicum]
MKNQSIAKLELAESISFYLQGWLMSENANTTQQIMSSFHRASSLYINRLIVQLILQNGSSPLFSMYILPSGSSSRKQYIYISPGLLDAFNTCMLNMNDVSEEITKTKIFKYLQNVGANSNTIYMLDGVFEFYSQIKN